MKRLTLLLLICSSTAMAIETPSYRAIRQDGDFEVREYPDLPVARTASGGGDFMRLFRYISGDNAGTQKIAMTAPVLVQHGGKDAGMSFVAPAELARSGKVPAPKDPAVSLATLPAGTWAVLRFSGGRNEKNENASLAALRARAAQADLKTEGEPLFAYFDPPWIPGFMRHNEVMLRVAQP